MVDKWVMTDTKRGWACEPIRFKSMQVRQSVLYFIGNVGEEYTVGDGDKDGELGIKDKEDSWLTLLFEWCIWLWVGFQLNFEAALSYDLRVAHGIWVNAFEFMDNG